MKRKQPEIIFFSEYFYPSQTSTAYYLTKIATRLASEFPGTVHIFCATPDQQGTSPKKKFPENLQIHRIDHGKKDKNNLIQRLIKFLRISIKFSFAAILRAKKGDVVFSVTNPAFIIPILAFLKKILNFDFILLAYDIFPENLVAAGLSQKNKLSYYFCKKIFDWGYIQADRVISIGRDMTEILKQKGVDSERIVLLPNWANTDEIVPSPKIGNPLVDKYGLSGLRVFMFAGNIGRVQGIPDFLKVISASSNNNAAFLFIGDGAMKNDLEQFQKNFPDKKIFCHPYLPMSQQNLFLNSCDVAIVTLGKNMLGLGVPSKSYYSMASGHPILYIGEKESEVAMMLKEARCGWQVDPGDIKGCVKIINDICTMSDSDLRAQGEKMRSYIENHYSEKIMLEKYSHFLWTFLSQKVIEKNREVE